MAVVPYDRRDIERIFRGIVTSKKRGDVNVKIGFIVQFEIEGGTDEQVANCVINPYEALARHKMVSIVDKALTILDGTEVSKNKQYVDPLVHTVVEGTHPNPNVHEAVKKEIASTVHYGTVISPEARAAAEYWDAHNSEL